jgi:peptide/nickel transport system ATP-binding protein
MPIPAATVINTSRCPFSADRCVREEPALQAVEDNHFSACHYPDQVEKFRRLAKDQATWKKAEGNA